MVYFLGFITAVVFAVFFTKLTIRWAYRYGFVDDPNRKHGAIIHNNVIPRAGGVPVYLATLLALLVIVLSFWFGGEELYTLDWGGDSVKHVVGVFVAGACIVLMGLMDDKYDLSPRLRLVLMFLFALVVVGFGVGISYITNPFLGGVLHLNDWVIPLYVMGDLHTIVVWADILAVFWIVMLMNVVNWSSGLDGQNAGISVVALTVLGFASLRYDRLSEPTALLSFVCAGAFFGFLIFSAYPQKIMPGFGGSTFSGFMISVLAILSGAKLATAMIVLAIPVIDAGWVFFRRLYYRRNPMKNDRTHLHHYLLDIGWSKRRIAFFYWFICALLGILVLQVNSQTKVFTFLGVLVLFFLFFIWIHYSLPSSKPSDRGNG